MCGIVAIRSLSAPVDRDRLCRAMNALRHRGPDDEGQWVSPDGLVGLGHRRLSVIDLETGAQPICNETGSIAVIANGEFYGFEKIRKVLEQRGHRFGTRSDTEIIVHLYEDFGDNCVEHLRGEFAFVLWDDTRQRLLAGRDRFGIKPLFYCERDGELLFASEAKSLFAAGIPARWDNDTVLRSLFLSLSPDQSLFAGIRQIPPAHVLVSTGASVSLRRYWNADYPEADQSFADSESVCIERVRELTHEAISLRMRADVPVGCLLSGGLDSSSVLGFASRMSEKPMRAFTIAFDEAGYDESELARETALFLGADFEPVDASKPRLAESFEDSVAHGEIVQYNAHGTARFLLSRAIQNAGYKVALAGEGADELFAGYGFASSAVLSQSSSNPVRRKIATAVRLLRPRNSAERDIARVSPWLVRAARVLHLTPSMMDPLARRMVILESLLSKAFLESVATHDPYRELFEEMSPLPAIRGRESAKQLIYLWMNSVFPSYVLAADRADMAHGVEVRLPFLDHVLFDYVRNIPVQILAAGGVRKHVLREAAAQFLPDGARKRAKKPLMAPSFTSRRHDPLFMRVREILTHQHLKKVPFLDSARVQRLALDNEADTMSTRDPLLLMAASLCIIQDRYRVT